MPSLKKDNVDPSSLHLIFAILPLERFGLCANDSVINRKDNNKALAVIESLNKVDLKASQRARQKYLLGSVLSKLWRNNDAIKAYNASIKADSKSAWAKLAKDAKEI